MMNRPGTGLAAAFRALQLSALPLMALPLISPLVAQATVKVYPAPAGIAAAPDRQVSVDGQNVFVYETPVNFNRVYSTTPTLEKTPVAYFDFTGSAKVTVTAPGVTVTSALIRPASYGVQPQINGNQITFTVTKPGDLTLELNGSPHRALHLFADSIEANPLTGGGGNVRYYGPGVYDVGTLGLGGGQTIYIAGGAVVYGNIDAGGASGATIRGRGILNGSHAAGSGKNMVSLHDNSNNINVNGIILLNTPTWNFNIRTCNNIHINDVKIIGANPNSDGIDFVGCQNSDVTRCFIRAWDDCLCVKSDNNGNSSGLTFSGCTIWTDLAQSMEIGYETRADLMSGINFKDMDVIHAFHKPVMSIHAGDRATIQDVHYENIRVEDVELNDDPGDNLLMDLWIGTSVWTQDASRGHIKNVTFNNINAVSGKTPRARFNGFDAGHLVESVTVTDYTLFCKPVKQASDGGFLMTNTSNIQFVYDIAGNPCSSAIAPVANPGMPSLEIDQSRPGRMLFRRPGEHPGMLWNAAGRLAPLPLGDAKARGVPAP